MSFLLAALCSSTAFLISHQSDFSVYEHQCIWAILNTVGHHSSVYMSSIVYCQSQSIKVYEQYCLLSVTVLQCIRAVLSTVSHSPSMYMSSIIYSQSQFISIYEQYYLLSVTVHQLYEQYYLLSVTVRQCIWAVLSTVSHSLSMYKKCIFHCES